MSTSLLAYATYLPAFRLSPADLGTRGGTRVVASFDEDSTTLGVEAALTVLRSLDISTDSELESIYFATTSPAYLDKTNAVAIHAALGLAPEVFAADFVGSGRSGFAALRAANSGGGLAIMSDVRVGKSGSPDEKLGGDGAAAFLFGEGEGLADVIAQFSLSAEFLDRWRNPESATGEQWEERFGFEQYASLIKTAAARALTAAGLEQADHVIVTCPNSGVVKRAKTLVKARLTTSGSPIGFSGAADAGLALSAALDIAGPQETVMVISAVDGCDVLVLRTSAGIVDRRQAVPVSNQLDGGRDVPYVTYLSWRGLLSRELPRRPEPDRPAGPPSARTTGWKFSFSGSRCKLCDFVHLPPARVCRKCDSVDDMATAPLSRLGGSVATYTVDRLAYSPSPPVVDAVVNFDGGGRYALEVADAVPGALAVGSRVTLTFRRLFTAGGVHNYFWKARHVVGPENDSQGSET